MLPMLQIFGCLLFGLIIVNAVPFQLNCENPFDCRWISGTDEVKSRPMIESIPFSMICSTPFDCHWVRNDDLKPFYDSERSRRMFLPSFRSMSNFYNPLKNLLCFVFKAFQRDTVGKNVNVFI